MKAPDIQPRDLIYNTEAVLIAAVHKTTHKLELGLASWEVNKKTNKFF